MEIVKPSIKVHWLIDPDTILKHIESCAKKCYQAEHTINEDSYRIFVPKLIERKHESTIEHISITVDIITNRGVTHELVRHRICSFSQESTRYCNYSRDKFGNSIKVIEPTYFSINEPTKKILFPNCEAFFEGKTLFSFQKEYKMNSFDIWYLSCMFDEWAYNALINEFGKTAQEAREVLPNSLKTEISVTANLREWRHIFKLRCAKDAHPQIRDISYMILEEFNKKLPEVFGDIYKQMLPLK